jgi:tetratricopeptide (TPR) repeat protein
MSSTPINRRAITLPALAACLLWTAPAFAQKPSGGGAGNPGGNTGASPGNIPSANVPGSTTNPTGNVPFGSTTNRNQTTTPFPGTQQQQQTPIFLSGVVMFDDGTPANPNIRIERVCSGQKHLEAHTDSKGRFSFQLGQNMMVDTEASDQFGGGAPFGRSGTSSMGGPGGFGNSSRELWNCELQASYPGYRSDTVELAMRHPMDPPDVGTIVLHHMGNVEGTTISLTTALAPKNAQKDYQKGLQLAQKGKFEEAEAKLQSATELYPKYAMAWYHLGQIQQQGGRAGEARKSYEAAIAADSKFVSPYQQMALLAAQAGNWEDAAKFSKQVITLDPVEYPASFWYNAVANYNLKRAAEAEKSIQDLLKLDTRHKFPDAENMMAQLLLDKGNYAAAAGHLRNYLTLVPNAKNADNLKQILLKIDQANAAAPKQ